jgi:Bacterial SH3 domain
MTRSHVLSAVLGILLLVQGCAPVQPQAIIDEAPQTEEAVPTETATPLPTPMPDPTATASPTLTATPAVRVTAIDGNLYIRRGPGTVYNRIGLLKKGESANVIGQDVLSKWVQIIIPNTEITGWVSLLTPFSQIDGDLPEIPSFTFTEWPEPAYIKNCTEHDMLIGPNEIYLYSLWTNSKYLNEEQFDPGVYEVYDLFVPGEPLVQTIDLQEGETFYITLNGLGVEHHCP